MQKFEKISYLRTITSLRGMSVLGVLLYHSKYQLFASGFLGVDVFFVISGFLIGNILFSEIAKNDFKFTIFYLKRLRRLLPSLIFTILFSILLSYLFLLPEDYKLFNYSIPYTLFFVGNYFFWKTNDYFSPDTDIMPLSHLWSLSIEEQFYFLLPLLIFFLFKFHLFRSNLKPIIFFGIFVSFIYTIFGFYILPFECPATNCIEVTNFYWLHTRAWELLIGVFLNFFTLRKIRLNRIFLLTGFFLIVVSFMITQNKYNHPGVGTLPSILGTVLIILSSVKNDINFLSKSSILYFLGKISYSLYLIHFPIFVIRNYYGLNFKIFKNFDILPILFIFLSILISFLMWKNIEVPFRNFDNINNKNFLILLSFGVILILILSLSSLLPKKTLNSEYEKFNFSTDFNIARECFFEIIPENPIEIDQCMKPQNGKKNILIVGSSVAQNIYKGLLEVEQSSINFDLVVATGCPPLIEKYDFDIPNFSKNKCEVIYKQVNKNILENNYSKIIIIYQWSELLNYEVKEGKFLLDYTIENILQKISKDNLFIIGQPVIWNTRLDIFAIRELNLKNSLDNYNSAHINESIFTTEQKLKEKLSYLKINSYSLIDFFCIDKKCLLFQIENDKYFFASRDFIHISDYFSQKIGLELFNSLLE